MLILSSQRSGSTLLGGRMRNLRVDAVWPTELARSLEVLEAFGLDRLFGPGPDPLVGADEVLLRP